MHREDMLTRKTPIGHHLLPVIICLLSLSCSAIKNFSRSHPSEKGNWLHCLSFTSSEEWWWIMSALTWLELEPLLAEAEHHNAQEWQTVTFRHILSKEYRKLRTSTWWARTGKFIMNWSDSYFDVLLIQRYLWCDFTVIKCASNTLASDGMHFSFLFSNILVVYWRLQ